MTDHRTRIREIVEGYGAMPDPARLPAIVDEIANLDCSCTPGSEGPDEMCRIHGRYTFEDLTRMLMVIHGVTIGQMPTSGEISEISTVQLLTELTDRAMTTEARAGAPEPMLHLGPDF